MGPDDEIRVFVCSTAGIEAVTGVSLRGMRVVSAALHQPVLIMIALCISTIGLTAQSAPFYQIPGYLLTGAAAATAFGLINSLGNLGGFVAPTVFGGLKDATGNYTLPSYIMGGVLILAAVLTAFLPRMFKSLDPKSPPANAISD